MKKTILCALLAATAAAATAADYQIDPHHANARFAIDHFGTSTNVGGFYQLEGTVKFDAAKRSGSIDITIPLNKLQPGSEHFTKHLLSADIFNAEKHPNIRFVSDKFHFVGKKVSAVSGLLTMNGKTQPVTLKANKFNCYQNPMKKVETCGGDFSATLDRSKWGVNYLVDAGMTKTVGIQIQIEAFKQ